MDAATAPDNPDAIDIGKTSGAQSPPARHVLTLAAALTLLWAGALALIVQTVVPTDVGWYLVATKKWLAGTELYTGIVEVNPPLAFYLIAPAIWIAQSGLLGEQTALFVYVALLIALSLAWCCRLILKARLEPRLSVLLCLALFAALFLLPFDDFGQREHFTLILAMPLILMSALFAGANLSWPERIAIGLFALPGLALKPFFLAVPLMITIARIAMHGSLRQRLRTLLAPENLAIGVGCIAYLGFVWFWHPAYFEVLIPLARATYSGIEHDFAASMRLVGLTILLGFPVLLALWARSAPARDWPVIVFFAATAGFAVAYLVQGKGWYYHAVPAVACAVVAAALYAGSLLQGRSRPLAPMLALAAVAYVGVINPLASGTYMHPETEHILARHADRLKHRRIAGWNPRIETAFPLVNMVQSEWTVRYPSLWPLAGALQARNDDDPEIRQTGERTVADLRSNLVDDLITQKPDIILLPSGLGENFLNLLRADPRFDDAFAGFARIDTVDEIEIWERSGEEADKSSQGSKRSSLGGR